MSSKFQRQRRRALTWETNNGCATDEILFTERVGNKKAHNPPKIKIGHVRTTTIGHVDSFGILVDAVF